MSVLDRKLRREVFRAKGILLAIGAIMTVGVLSYVAMRSLYYDLRGAQQSYYRRCRMADFWLSVKKVPLAELDRAARLAGIRQIHPRIQFYATVDLEDVIKPLNGLVVSLPDEPEPVINGVVMREGGYFTKRRDNEVIVNDKFAQARNVGVGERIDLLLNNRRHPFHVVGTAISSEFAYLASPGSIAPDPAHFGVFYLKRSYAEEIFDMDGAANQVVGLLAPGTAAQRQQRMRQLKRLLEPFGSQRATLRKDQTSHLFVSTEIEGLGVFATILPAIFVSVAALVLNILMTRLADQQRTVIGTLKAIGYSDRQIAAHFLKFGILVGLVGGAAGCVCGYWLSLSIKGIYRQFYEFPSLPTGVYPGTYLVGLAISIACAVAGSWRGARLAMRLQPAAAMRPKPPARGGRIWLERWSAVWNRLSFGWRMALRNVLRNRMRTAVGLFATSMGTSLIVLSLMSMEAMNFMIDFQFNKMLRSDLDLTFESDRSEAALDEARRLPGVQYAEPTLHVPCTFTKGTRSKQGGITGLVHGARLTVPRDLAGDRLTVPQHGLLMTAKMSELLDVEVGQTVLVRPSQGLQRTIRMPVMRIAESYLGTAVYADLDYLSRQVGESRAISGVQLAVAADDAAWRTLYRKLKKTPAIQGLSARSDVMRNLQQALVESQQVSLVMMVGFAGVIFFGSVLNASLVSLAERQREIATLRVLGYGSWQVGMLMLRETMVVTLFGTPLGMLLGWYLYVSMARLYDMEVMRLPIVSAPWIWITTALLAVAFTLAAHLFVQRRIHRMNWLEALQVKE